LQALVAATGCPSLRGDVRCAGGSGVHGLPFNQFRIEHVRELGAGGLGRVDEVKVVLSNAVGKPIGSLWARKRLNEKWNAQPTIRQRFEREIAALQTMSHENIITFEGENLAGEERFYLMPVYGNSLRRYIAGGSKTGDWRFAASRGAVLASALAYAHSLGFIHRDIKPDNILFNPAGPLTISDWGLGYFVHRESKVLAQLTRGGMGTEYYCSLEQWGTGKCDQRGDIYSLGMTLDELLVGKQRAITVGQGVGHFAPAGKEPGERHLRGLLGRMTAPFATNRPTDMNVVATELRAIAAL